MENQGEGKGHEIPTVSGGDYGVGPKSKRRDRFTAEMKDRQARGKDPMTGEAPRAEELNAAEREALTDGKGSAKIYYAGDEYEAIERRKRAMAILDSPELLGMYAQERGDSIASSRYHLQHVMCGIEDTRKPYKPTAYQPENIGVENVRPWSPRNTTGGLNRDDMNDQAEDDEIAHMHSLSVNDDPES